MSMPRIGHINFLNVLPLTYSYKHGYSEGMSLTYAVPSKLNSDIKNANLDISPISSIEYARQSKNLLLLPNICIRADCDVQSIVLVSKKPIERINSDKITLTSKSATSHCLLKIIMTEGYGARPTYEVANISAENPILADTTASLLIGDDALYNYLNTPKNLYCYDIGKEWHKLTRHSMVYAVWVVRKEFANESPELVKNAYNKIISGMQSGIKNKNLAIKSVLQEKPFTYEILDQYLGGIIKWDLPKEAIDSLMIYYQSAYKLHLIDSVPEIEFVDIASI
ncbi:MAG: menaquinone biosynthesis protein [Selenomonadaceae bacterium]|nr:menaquinone biosynthesis protein [Selenomonadaceae bacterium]